MNPEVRVEELEDALRDILDITGAWTRGMSDEQKLDAIERAAETALGLRRAGVGS